MSEREHTKQRVEEPIPAWFRQEHAIRIMPDTSFGLYAGEEEVGIRQMGDSPVEFVPKEAAFLFGDSPNELFFRASFSSVIKMDGTNEEEKPVREKLYDMKIATFCDFSGPIAKTFHGIAVFHDALDMIPADKSFPSPSLEEEALRADRLLLPVSISENDEEEDFPRELISVSEAMRPANEEIREAIDAEIEQGDGEFCARCEMCENEYHPFDIVFMGSRCLTIVHGDEFTGDWLAEEEPFGNEPPLWFSETDHLPSPAFQAQKCRELFATNFPGVPVAAIVVMPQHSFVINEDEMVDIWRERCNVHVVQTKKRKKGLLHTLHECLEALPEVSGAPSGADIEGMKALARKLVCKPVDWSRM